jgi:hypothetical protein
MGRTDAFFDPWQQENMPCAVHMPVCRDTDLVALSLLQTLIGARGDHSSQPRMLAVPIDTL